jgi:hypothetical protein
MSQRPTTVAGRRAAGLKNHVAHRGLIIKKTVAELFDVHPKTVDRDVDRGPIDPPVMIKGRAFWPRDYIDGVLANWARQGRALAAVGHAGRRGGGL